MSQPQRIHTQRAFTLIELSIVLVIIGLIIGGILVGRDMIIAAEANAFMQKAQQIERAYNTFRVKYNCLPGDCKNAAELGLGVSGNGDRQILVETGTTATPCRSSSVVNRVHGECQTFWVHLSAASLIPETNLQDYNGGAISGDTLTDYYPKWGKGYVHLMQHQGNIYLRSGLSGITDGQTRAQFGISALSGAHMQIIANKYDIPHDCESNAININDCPQVHGKKYIPTATRTGDVAYNYLGLYGPYGGGPCSLSGQWVEDGKCNLLYRLN